MILGDATTVPWLQALPTPWPFLIVINTSTSAPQPFWSYVLQYVIQAAAAGATIFAAYMAVRGAFATAARNAETSLRLQQAQIEAEDRRIAVKNARTDRAIRSQIGLFAYEAAHVVYLEGMHPGVGDAEYNKPRYDALQRYIARTFDLDVAEAFSDDELQSLHSAATYARVFMERILESWKANVTDVQRKNVTSIASDLYPRFIEVLDITNYSLARDFRDERRNALKEKRALDEATRSKSP